VPGIYATGSQTDVAIESERLSRTTPSIFILSIRDRDEPATESDLIVDAA